MRWGIIAVLTAALLSAGAAPARPFKHAYKSKYAHVDFAWSNEAEAVPHLVKRFRVELAKQQADTIEGGKQEFEFHPVGWDSSTKITTSGESPRLLSLSRTYWAFTGGAHGNGSTTGLLWDRALAKEIKFASLFTSPTRYEQVLRGSYCKALDAERRKRRGNDYVPGGGNYTLAAAFSEFDRCPAFSALAMIPAAARRNGKLDRIHIIAAAYIAGPYAEGDYDIVLTVGPQLIRLMKPQYRASFEAQRQ